MFISWTLVISWFCISLQRRIYIWLILQYLKWFIVENIHYIFTSSLCLPHSFISPILLNILLPNILYSTFCPSFLLYHPSIIPSASSLFSWTHMRSSVTPCLSNPFFTSILSPSSHFSLFLSSFLQSRSCPLCSYNPYYLEASAFSSARPTQVNNIDQWKSLILTSAVFVCVCAFTYV